MKNSRSRPLAITTGDHHGIGPEVISKGLYLLRKKITLDNILILGPPSLYEPFRKWLPPQSSKWHVWKEKEIFSNKWLGTKKDHLNFLSPEVPTSKRSIETSFLCGRYIELATYGCLEKKFSGMCTGPIEKNELIRGGYHFNGHTEMLQHLCHTKSVTMMMAGPILLNQKAETKGLRISLATTHVPLKKISAVLTEQKILQTIENTYLTLKEKFKLNKPRIAVLGLNPHAGDSGLFGDEEEQVIRPAIEKGKKLWTKLGVKIDGPFAPDGFFAQWLTEHYKKYDAVICMYHDQGLIPIKLLYFENAVNITLGLPIIRTSVDHGVGYDIAGKGIANPHSFMSALMLAKRLTT